MVGEGKDTLHGYIYIFSPYRKEYDFVSLFKRCDRKELTNGTGFGTKGKSSCEETAGSGMELLVPLGLLTSKEADCR